MTLSRSFDVFGLQFLFLLGWLFGPLVVFLLLLFFLGFLVALAVVWRVLCASLLLAFAWAVVGWFLLE